MGKQVAKTVEAKEAELNQAAEQSQEVLSNLYLEVQVLKSTNALEYTDEQDERSHQIPREIDNALRQVICAKQGQVAFLETEKNEELRKRNEEKQAAKNAAAEKVQQWLLGPGGFLSANPEEFGSFDNTAILRHPAYRNAENAAHDAENAILVNERQANALKADIEADTKRLEDRKAKRLAI